MVKNRSQIFLFFLGLQLALQPFVGSSWAQTPKYSQVSNLGEDYVGENEGKAKSEKFSGKKVTYFSNQELAEMELFVKDGKLVDRQGKLFDTTAGVLKTSYGDLKVTGQAIVVMTPDGRIYATNAQEVTKIHHSSLGQGKPTAFAGTLEVKNGVIKKISNDSGHYKPNFDQMLQFVEEIKSKKGNLDNSQLVIHEVKESTLSQIIENPKYKAVLDEHPELLVQWDMKDEKRVDKIKGILANYQGEAKTKMVERLLDVRMNSSSAEMKAMILEEAMASNAYGGNFGEITSKINGTFSSDRKYLKLYSQSILSKIGPSTSVAEKSAILSNYKEILSSVPEHIRKSSGFDELTSGVKNQLGYQDMSLDDFHKVLVSEPMNEVASGTSTVKATQPVVNTPVTSLETKTQKKGFLSSLTDLFCAKKK